MRPHLQKHHLLCIMAYMMLIHHWGFAQKLYSIYSPELMLSGADLRQGGVDLGIKPRFSGFFNVQQVGHTDINRSFGFYAGLSIKNIGFIADLDTVDLKYRTYNVGIPIALKFGKMDKKQFLFFGFEAEMAVHFKHKRIEGNSKSKESAWFSRETPRFMYHVFAGIQFNEYVGIKCRYYLHNFLNTNFTKIDNRLELKPYAQLHSQVITLSLYWNIEDANRKYELKPKSKAETGTQALY